jgi:RalA-binding protein 1
MPTRKRQKKTDSRVSELEKKIDALTASLQARATVPGIGGGASSAATPGHHVAGIPAASGKAPQRQASEGLGGLWINNDSDRSWTDSDPAASRQGLVASPVQQSQPSRSYRPSVFDPPDVTASHKRKATDYRDGSGEGSPAANSLQWQTAGRGSRTDIIDRGLLSMERAVELFQRYKDHMSKHLPAVVFPPSMTIMDLRREKPYLFLAVMAAASSETHGLQRVLQRELMELFAEKIVIVGEKNLELIQALHVAVIWYWPPEHFEELKFYQLVHMSAVMALDIGLGKKSAPKRGLPGFSWREHPFRRHPQPDPTSLECRRTWLTCHFLAANTAMSLHRPNLIRWSPFMTDSLELLRTSPDAYPTDKYFCHLIWTHRMAEDIGVQLSMDDPDTAVNIMDARTQYTLRGLERDLDKYIAAVPKDMMQR